MRCLIQAIRIHFLRRCNSTTSHNPYDLNPFSSPVFSSFRPHLLLFLLFHFLVLFFYSSSPSHSVFFFPFPVEKFFLAAFSTFFWKSRWIGLSRRVGEGAGEGEKKRVVKKAPRNNKKKRTTADVGKEKRRRSGKVVKKKKGELTILHHLPNSLTFFWMIP